MLRYNSLLLRSRAMREKIESGIGVQLQQHHLKTYIPLDLYEISYIKVKWYIFALDKWLCKKAVILVANYSNNITLLNNNSDQTNEYNFFEAAEYI